MVDSHAVVGSLAVASSIGVAGSLAVVGAAGVAGSAGVAGASAVTGSAGVAEAVRRGRQRRSRAEHRRGRLRGDLRRHRQRRLLGVRGLHRLRELQGLRRVHRLFRLYRRRRQDRRAQVTIRRAIPNLPVEDLAQSREFYAGFLGFDVAMDEDGFTMFASPSNRTAQITSPTARPGLDRGVREAHISVEVEDVDALHAEAVRRGLEIVYPLTDEPWGIRRFFVKDPDGTVINVAMHL